MKTDYPCPWTNPKGVLEWRRKDEGGGRDASKTNTTISGRNYSNLQEMEDEGKLSSLRVYEGMEVDSK